MKRLLCLWLPEWPLQRLRAARPELKRRAIGLYQRQGGLKRQVLHIVACSKEAREQGVAVGMPVAEASAARGLHWEEHDPAADRAALERLARRCESFSPTIGLEERQGPDCLLLDVTGLGPLFGGEAGLADQLTRAFLDRGLSIRLGIADTLGAAWAVGHHVRRGKRYWIVPPQQTGEALAPLPVDALRLEENTVGLLAEVGLQRIGQLLVLPRASLAARFEPQLLRRLDQALGVEPETIAAHHPPPDVVAQSKLEYPVDRPEIVHQLLEQLIGRIVRQLTPRQQGVLQLECRLDCERGAPLQFVIGLFRASAEPRHLLELARMQLDRQRLPGPLTAMRLAVLLAARLQSEQCELFVERTSSARQRALLVDRLSSRLGSPAVCRPSLAADAQPEYAFCYEPLSGGRRGRVSPAAANLPQRPLLLEPRPARLAAIVLSPDGPPAQFQWRGKQHHVARSWGPERIQTGWWRGRFVGRDYYRVETSNGERFWLFQSRRNWFLHGVFD